MNDERVARPTFCHGHVEGLAVTSDRRFVRFQPIATHSASTSSYLVQLTGVEHNKTGVAAQRIELYPHAEPQPGGDNHLMAEIRLRPGSYRASVRPLQLHGFLDDLPCVREPHRCSGGSTGSDPHWDAAAASNARCQQQRVCVSEPSYVPSSLEFRVGVREVSAGGDASSLRPCTLLPTGALQRGLWRGGEWAPYDCSRARAHDIDHAVSHRLLMIRAHLSHQAEIKERHTPIRQAEQITLW